MATREEARQEKNRYKRRALDAETRVARLEGEKAALDAALRSAPAPIANADYRVHSAWQLEYAAWRDKARAADKLEVK